MAEIKQKITAEEYFEMYPETTQPMELIDGEVIVSPAPSPSDQQIVVQLTRFLGNHISDNNLGELQVSPSDVHLKPDVVVQPDLFFVAKTNANCKIVEDKYWSGSPDLCVEIISPSSTRRDRVFKAEVYAQQGVREYWIIDPAARYIEVYALEGDQFKLIGDYGEGDQLKSLVLPELTLDLKAIFPEKS